MSESTAFYFGVWVYPGHLLYTPGGRTSNIPIHSLLGTHTDGLFAPMRHEHSGSLCWAGQGATRDRRLAIGDKSEEYPQGQFLRHRLRGFTLISWWDRCQGDGRGGCNGSFMLEGDHNSAEMVDKFQELFPGVAANVELVDVTPDAP